jgi:putative DNA primase/helicase
MNDVTDLPPDLIQTPSEVDIADCFADRHAHRLRYVAKGGQWLRYDGKCWREEQTLMAFDLSRALCREVAADRNNVREVKQILSAKTVAAVERIARADRRLAATMDQWDADPWLLNTPSGAINLRDGTLGPHSPEHFATKMTEVGPGGECLLWHQFLDTFTNNDRGLRDFLQRVCGYCLTGDCSEEALFFFFGTGGNGKSVFVNTIAKIMGSYHRAAPMETFTVSSTERHPTELAMLAGARLITSTETEEGKRWNEARIKAMTGRDRIPARFMRQDFFEFTPQFKLVMNGNHRPGLRTVDEAIRRRMNLIPCTAAISKANRDTELHEKLMAEASGILTWMIAGCLEWQRSGLGPPEAVTAATDDYLETEDALGAWIEECCDTGPNVSDSVNNLWTFWNDWAERAGEWVGNKRRLGQRLVDKGYARDREVDGKRIHRGIKAVRQPTGGRGRATFGNDPFTTQRGAPV